MVPVNVQIPQLLTDKQFKLAEVLSNIGEGDLENRTKRVQTIQTLYAFDLFCNFKFQESMTVLDKVKRRLRKAEEACSSLLALCNTFEHLSARH